jgi:hypothetical protein
MAAAKPAKRGARVRKYSAPGINGVDKGLFY